MLPPGDWQDRLHGVPTAVGIAVAVLAAVWAGPLLGILPAAAGWGLFAAYVSDDAVRALPALPAWLCAAIVTGIVASRLEVEGRARLEAAGQLDVLRAATDQELRDLTVRRRALVELLPAVTYEHAPGDRRSSLHVSAQVEALLGYSADEIEARPELLETLIHPDDRERVLGELGAGGDGAQPFRSEYRLLARDGRVVWVRDEASTVRDADGRPAYVQGLLSDAGEGRRAAQEREALRSAERAAVAEAAGRQRRLDLLADVGEVLASSLDADANLRRVAKLVVRDMADWCTFDLRDEDGAVRRVTVTHREPRPATGEPVTEPDAVASRVLESERPEKLSQPFPALAVPLSARGRTVGVLTLVRVTQGAEYGADDAALAQDVARRAALAVDNARLYREVEERAEASHVLTHVGDGVLLVDRSGVVRLWNPAAEVITGIPSASVVGRPSSEAIHGWQALAERIPVATTPEPSHAETFPIETERGERWISISGVEFFGGTVYAFRDVTEEHRLEELKADFVATASHELRTPLAAVYGAAQTLRRHDFALDESGRARFISLIVDESERLGRIVNEILLANQLDAGRLELSGEPFNATELVDRVAEAARTHAPPGLALEVTAPPSAPAVAADRDKVRQVLVNLIENAIKYSPDGGRIDVGVESDQEVVRFSVRDEGLGIPAEEQERIFEKFYRLDPDMTRGVGGTGLGLYICSELVDRMGGRIWVESREGQGSTFFCELPVAETAPRPVGPDAQEPSHVSGSG
jgi:PAS domain S-box-containing protein